MFLLNALIISIHAPTRGATANSTSINNKLMISIHAPTRGATVAFEFWVRAFYISIHAPTRGATHFSSFLCAKIRISIHAPTRGATTLFIIMPKKWQFQSTLLQEERHNLRKTIAGCFYFNPRSYKRSDGKNAQLSLYLSVIIIA